VGALAAYLFDPDRGRGRRSKLRDQLAGLIRRGGRRLSRGTRYAAATTSGRLRGLRHAFGGDGSAETPTDAVLAHRVETELFRDPSIPKGRMNVNAEEGTVVLRGTVDSSDQLRAIEARVASIGGVTEVRNLLHLEGTAAPHEPAAAR
jgi:osmotically-inducible protein OsmY